MTAIALVAGCATPTPSSTAGTRATARPSGGASPLASAAGPTAAPSSGPDDLTWEAGVHLPAFEPVATFEALQAAAAGVMPDSAFRLTALDGSDPVALARMLVAEPPVDLAVTAEPGAAIVTPAAPLDEGRRYRFLLRSPDGTVRGTWAVQAIGPLAVAQSTPGDQSTGVPSDTGIELTFNQPGIAATDVERFLAIEPAVAGRVEMAGRVAAFVPATPLAPGTLYTVTLRRGLPLAGTEEVLERPFTVRFETAATSPSPVRLLPARALVETRPSERAVISLNVDRFVADEDEGSSIPLPRRLGVTVHRLSDLDAAIAAWRQIDQAPDWTVATGMAPVSTAGLALALEGDVPLRRFSPQSDWSQYVRLPARLAGGWYVVTVRHEGIAAQVVLQVTDLAVYALVTTTQTIAWVNDLDTGRPAAGATATLAGVGLGRTGADGIVVARTPTRVVRGDPDGASPVIVVRSAGAAVFAPGGEQACAKCSGDGRPSPWWLVFQPDRTEYRSTDTLNAWGILRDRVTGDVPGRVEVTLDAWSAAGGTGTPVQRRTAEPDRNGAFVAHLPVTDLPIGDYELTLRVDGEIVASRSIRVNRILKPSWTLGIATSRRAVIDGQSVDVTANATFFEGTPVAGAAIRVEASDASATLHTDTRGTGVASLRLESEDEFEQWTVSTVSGHPVLPEEGEIEGTSSIAVFRAAVLVKAAPVLADGRLRVSGTVHATALRRFDARDVGWLEEVDPFGRLQPGARVHVAVVEHHYVRRQVGTEYDFITKRVVPVYEYDERTRDLEARTVVTDADGRFELTMPADPRRSYEVAVTARDAAGRSTTAHEWADAGSPLLETSYARLEGTEPAEGWSVGDRVALTFRGGSGAGPVARYLWTTTHAGLRSWAITASPRYRDRFGAADVPGFHVTAVRFTGTAYVVASGERRVAFRIEDRRLRVEVTPDQARYQPGGRVSLAVRTTNQAGRPVPASVYVGVVDEKLVSMGLVDATDPLLALYEDVGSGIIGRAWTHRDPRAEDNEGGGDTAGGDGDDGDGRSDFRDWLVARIVRTGADGRASLAFDLSDDLTSWRAMAAGATRSLLAGRGEALLPVSMPFFAELTVADSYVLADRPIVRVRAYGEGVSPDERVTFTVSSDTLPMAPVAVNARAFTAGEVALPELTPGTHRLRVEAVAGSGAGARRDVLTRTFTVVEARAVQATMGWSLLEAETPITAGEGLTRLVLADAGRGRVLPVLQGLAAENPNRGDRALAAGVAARVLRDVFGEEPSGGALDLDLRVFQQDGGVAVVPYASPSLELSALAAMAGDPRVGDLDRWFAEVAPTTREERAWLLVGLAATGAPVLTDVGELSTLPDLTPSERIALALAALAAGDEGLAGRLERDLLRELGERRGPWVRLRAGSADDSAVLTARLAIVAASIGDAVAADMDAYLDANPPRTTLVALERAIAARGWAARIPAADASVTLTVDGRPSELRIESSQPVRVALTPAQAATATLAPGSGAVLVTTRVDRPLELGWLDAPAWLDPVRRVTPGDTFGVEDTVIVELTMDAPPQASEGCWLVTEWVPSGLVPVASPRWFIGQEDESAGPEATGPWSIRGQRLDFCLGGSQAPVERLRYVARVVTPGSYAWEPAVVQSPLEAGVGAVVPATTITIRGER